MEQRNIKWLAGSIGLLVVIVFFVFSNSMRKTEAGKSLEDFLTVSMPRPIKNMILGFSLSGRNVTREIEIVADKSALPKTTDKKNPGSQTKATVDKGQATKKAAAARAAAARRYAQEQAFRARIVEESERYRRFLQDQQRYHQDVADKYDDYGYMQKRNAQNPVPAETGEGEKEPKLDAAAWRSLVLAQPTAANVQKMIQAYVAGDLDAQTYYEIVESLIKDNSEEKRKMGLWALTSTHHSKAFEMASHLVAEVDADTQKRLKDYMYGYNKPQTLNILAQVLQSSDAVAASAAATAISQAVEKLKNGQQQNTADRGGRQQGAGQALTLSSYQQLVPTLQYLSTRTGSTLSQWAQNLLSQLRSNTSPA